jgi:hypothetical protein
MKNIQDTTNFTFLFIKNAHVGAPSGLHTFDRANSESYDITVQDIVRSSLFMHRNNIDEAIQKVDVDKPAEMFRKEGLTYNMKGELDDKV